MKQPHFQVVAEHFIAFALRDVVGVAALVAFNVNTKDIGDILTVVVERAFRDGIVFVLARPSVVQFFQRDALVFRVGNGVGNPDAFDEFVHDALIFKDKSSE